MSDLETHRRFMHEALDLAERAATQGEVPVGAVVVQAGAVVGRGSNAPIERCDPTAHAEVVALRAAASALGNYRLPGCTLYVTVEPCAMCVGALVHARIATLVYGTVEPRTGAVESAFSLLGPALHNHTVEVIAGVEAARARELIQAFFRARRGGGG
ncbi:MAG: tRNA adenosine(34) deaminase TadA [Pseudomonadota bacterium]